MCLYENKGLDPSVIKMEILVKIPPNKKTEFLQVVEDICQSYSESELGSTFTVFQHLREAQLYFCTGEWDLRKHLRNFMKSENFELLIGAIQVLGDIQYARIHDIHTIEEIKI